MLTGKNIVGNHPAENMRRECLHTASTVTAVHSTNPQTQQKGQLGVPMVLRKTKVMGGLESALPLPPCDPPDSDRGGVTPNPDRLAHAADEHSEI
jgi:hypothetical protein